MLGVITTYICLDCYNVFSRPEKYIDKCGLDTPPFLKRKVCPKCGGECYTKAIECDICHKYITGDYIKTKDDTNICENCYEYKNLTE